MGAQKEPMPLEPMKRSFVGFYSLLPSEADGDKELLDKLIKRDKNRITYLPVLGFANENKKTTYSADRLPKNGLGEYLWEPSLKQRAAKEEDNSLSMIFSGLKTPDDFFLFAKQYGALLRFDAVRSIDNMPIEAISKKVLLRTFNQKSGIKSNEDMKLSLACKAEVSPSHYEELDDWRLASQIIRIAYLIRSMLNEGFTHSEEKGVLTIERKHSHVALSVAYTDGVFYLPLFGSNDHDTYISDGNGYIERCLKNERTRIKDGADELHRDYKAKIHHTSFGWPQMILHGNNRCKTIKNVVTDMLERASEYLAFIHKIDMSLMLHRGKIYYGFDSLLSFLWYDYINVISGMIGFSICEYCGRPFFTNNSGHKKQFCTTNCRVKAYYHRRKETK